VAAGGVFDFAGAVAGRVVVGVAAPVRVGTPDGRLSRRGLAGAGYGGPGVGQLAQRVVVEALVGDGVGAAGFFDRFDVAGVVVTVGFGEFLVPAAGVRLVLSVCPVGQQPAGRLVGVGGAPDLFGAGAEQLLVDRTPRLVAGAGDVGVQAGDGEWAAGGVVGVGDRLLGK